MALIFSAVAWGETAGVTLPFGCCPRRRLFLCQVLGGGIVAGGSDGVGGMGRPWPRAGGASRGGDHDLCCLLARRLFGWLLALDGRVVGGRRRGRDVESEADAFLRLNQ